MTTGIEQNREQAETLGLEDREDIDRQVARVLNHPLFHQSKRLPIFLRYVVAQSFGPGLEGSAKERTLGVEVFGRKPDYDNNSDPIVRVTATELRKKLAQYYYEDGHNDEIRIELPSGSYLPKFRRARVPQQETQGNKAAGVEQPPPSSHLRDTVAPEAIPPVAANVEPATDPEFPAIAPVTQQSSGVRPRWQWSSLFAVSLIPIVWLLVQALHPSPTAQLRHFFRAFTGSNTHVLIVMPVIGSDNAKQSGAPTSQSSVSPNLSLEDTNIAVHIASEIAREDVHYQLVSAAETSLAELRTGPSVYIGGLDNIWTMRIMKDTPFVFEEAPDHRTGRILDSASHGQKAWIVDIDVPHTHIVHDYGVVARYLSPLTGQPVLIAAGISSQGTQAAGELVSSAAFRLIAPLVKKGQNISVVLEVDAIDGHTGEPRIVASRQW